MEFVYLLLGVIAGAVISQHFAVESSKELRAETAELRKLINIMLESLYDAGAIDLAHDEQGKISGWKVNLKGTGKFGFTGTAHLTETQETSGFAQSKTASHAEVVADLPENEPGSTPT